MAAGLPIEGTDAKLARAGDIARKDVPTATVEERLSVVRERARRSGRDAVVVVNGQNVVMGLLRAKELQQDGDLTIEQAMRPGPSTFRPYVSAREMADYMVEHKLECSPITTSDGKLVGLLYQADAVSAAGKEAA
ncbi:MAG TPA: CBS domain-containing protein [Candidatus Dormibacteraeota bacterium]|nr:CBS domain-containing protein [Candidatus Dormibacteraeota bacterium]